MRSFFKRTPGKDENTHDTLSFAGLNLDRDFGFPYFKGG